jgi:site-specific DNA recombinase
MSAAAIYARYSSDLQREASIEDQNRICRERAAREGWAVYKYYSDHGISGASLIRPGIQKLLQDALEGRFDIIVTESLDRLSRDQEDIAHIFKRITFAGGRIVTVSEGEINELHIGLKGTMGALYLKDLADKTRRGLRGRVEAGKSGGGNSYGYDVVRGAGPDGQPLTGERRINAQEAAIVRRIFEDYAAGVSPRAIAKRLNAEGVSGPLGGTWGPSTIHGNRQRGTGILNNELYIGRLVWNRLRYVKDPRTGTRVSRLNPDSGRIIQNVAALRMVDQDLWEHVKTRQGALEAGRRSGEAPGYWERRRPRYLFTGRMRCAVCGGGIVHFNKVYIGCANARNKGTCDNKATMRRDDLEARTLWPLASSIAVRLRPMCRWRRPLRSQGSGCRVWISSSYRWLEGPEGQTAVLREVHGEVHVEFEHGGERRPSRHRHRRASFPRAQTRLWSAGPIQEGTRLWGRCIRKWQVYELGLAA